MSNAPHTVVIGGGIIGLTCAHALRCRGHEVTILDQGDLADGCSAANAGWIVPSFSAPIAAPGLTTKSLGWMLRPDSPFHLSLRVSPHFATWLWRFWRHCNRRDYARGMNALARLNRTTMQRFDALAADGIRFERHRRGVLFAFLDEAELRSTHARLSKLGEWGYAQPELLRGARLSAAEPVLKNEVCGGLYLASEQHVRPDTLNEGLIEHLRSAGARLRAKVEVLDWQTEDHRIAAVRTTAGTIRGDHFVLAAGARSGLLGKRLGLRLPLQAGKGYSLTFDKDLPGLRQPLDLVEAGIVCSTFDRGWRIAGTMELSGINDYASARRLDALRRSAKRYLNLPAQAVEGGHARMGQRPLTPDGLPVIGRMPDHANGYVATGHAMLGLTLAPVTADLIADLITRGNSDIESAAFDPGRFARWKHGSTSHPAPLDARQQAQGVGATTRTGPT